MDRPIFGDRVKSADVVMVALTEFEGDLAEVGIHVHPHPTWLFTNLIHIDDGSDDHSRGCALFGFSDCSKETDYTEDRYGLLSRSNEAFSNLMTIQKEYSFNPGRLFSFLETPLSHHGTRKPPPGFHTTSKRRMIRMHVGVPVELAKSIYGIDRDEYIKLICPAPTESNERIIPCINKEVHNIFVAADEQRGAAQRLDVDHIPISVTRW